MVEKPKLRNIHVQRTIYQGQPVFVLQDTLRLTDAAIILPEALGPVAALCDGEHTLSEIRAILEVRYGLRLTQSMLEDLFHQFDQALLLESDTFFQARQKAVDAYQTQPFRQPALAGPSYPADPDQLRSMLQSYLDQVNGMAPAPPASRGIITPHIDYQRGGPTYAQVWASAAEAVRQAELAIIFGTDHNGGFGALTLTRQNYASPLGVMPTDRELVDRLAAILGPEAAFAEELNHISEHSIELALIWLQYIREGESCPVLPVLCGSFLPFMLGQAGLEDMPHYNAFIEALREEIAGRRTVVVAAGDLAHLGPAFDGPPLDEAAYARMQTEDNILMDAICAGDPLAFFKLMQSGQYQRNVCGSAPFYFTLSILGQTQGQTIAYDRCPADPEDTSFVSVCGIVLT